MALRKLITHSKAYDLFTVLGISFHISFIFPFSCSSFPWPRLLSSFTTSRAQTALTLNTLMQLSQLQASATEPLLFSSFLLRKLPFCSLPPSPLFLVGETRAAQVPTLSFITLIRQLLALVWWLLETPGSPMATQKSPFPWAAAGNFYFINLRIINKAWLSTLKAQKEEKGKGFVLKLARTFYKSSAGFIEINVSSRAPVLAGEHERRSAIEASIKARRATLTKTRREKPRCDLISLHLVLLVASTQVRFYELPYSLPQWVQKLD